MCFNKEVSLVIFIYGVLTSAKLLNKGSTETDTELQKIYYSVGIFILVVALMQINEFGLWLYQPPFTKNAKFINQIFSICVYATLFIQAVGLYFSVMYFDLFKSEGNWTPEKIILTILFILQTIGVLWALFNMKSWFGSMVSQPNCRHNGKLQSSRLSWAASHVYNEKSNSMYLLYIISYFALNLMCTYYILTPIGMGISMLIIFVAFIFSQFIYKCNYLQYGSIWCFIIVVLCCAIFLFDDKIVMDIRDYWKFK